MLLPGTAFVELALQAGEAAGGRHLDELTLHAPLVLPAPRTSRAASRSRSRWRRPTRPAVAPSASAPAPTAGPGPGTRPAILTDRLPAAGAPDPVWPPAGAQPIAVDEFYPRRAAAGIEYGPAFRGLTAAWRDGDGIAAEIVLPDEAGAADGYGLHPALLDAALHALEYLPGRGGELALPFAWSGVACRAAGATALRVRISNSGSGGGGDSVSVRLADAQGEPDRRDLDPHPAAAAGRPGPNRTGLAFELDWTPADLPADDAAGPAARVLARPASVPADVPAQVHAATAWALAAIQEHLAEPGDGPLVLLTRGAVAATPGEAVDDLAGAAVWGLVRSAQTEEPGRFLLLDTDLDRPVPATPCRP